MASAAAPEPTIHRAYRIDEFERGVEWGEQITEADAVALRLQGYDVVVRGRDGGRNKTVAARIERAVCGNEACHDRKEWRAASLPHWHPKSRIPAGHTFYEREGEKARKRKA